MGSGTRVEVTARGAVPLEDRVVLAGRSRPTSPRRATTGIPDAPGLVRRRVNQQLDRCAEARIGAVIAPAGAGKTTALAHWARGSALDVTWWRATADADDPVASTIAGLAEAVHALAPQWSRATCRESLLDRLQEYDGAPVIVIDDYHHVDHPEVGDLLEDLLQASRARLIVATRREPALNLARSELPSLVLGSEDLRFRQPETEELFSCVYGRPLADEEGWLLTRQTDGLAAALHLFHQATHSGSEQARRQVLRDFPGGATFAMGYVAREVLAGLDPADVRLLRLTSPLETLTATRCTELLGSDADLRLRRLVRRGLLRRLPGGYAVARVVRRHLLEELAAELGPDGFAAQVRWCAARMDADGHPADAVRCYVSGGDWVGALAVLEGDGIAVLADPDLDWLDAPIAVGPWADAARAVRALRAGRFDDLRKALPAEPPCGPDALVALDRRLRRILRLWTEADIAPGEEWFERLRSTLHRPDPRRYADHAVGREDLEHRLLHAVECAVAGDLRTARRLLAMASGAGVVGLALSALSALLSGRTNLSEVVDEAERAGVPWVARIASGLATPADLARRIAEADAVDDAWGALSLAAVHAVRGLKENVSVAAFEELVARCRTLGAPALEAWARSGLALAASLSGSPEAVREAELAVGFAHTAQVPGALALAWGVLGTVRRDAGLLADAAAEADRIGLDCRAWELISGDLPVHAPATVNEAPPPLELRCFGGFDIRVAGTEPSFRGVRPRARELLRMLALHAGTPVHRELLVDAMWPQLDCSAGTHNLHVCVSSLRAALEPGVARGASRLLVRDGDRYLLALPPESVADLRDFDLATRRADDFRTQGDVEQSAAALEEALGLYVGDVLPEDGPSEWVVGVRDRYRVRAAEAAALLAELRLGQRRAADAAAAAQRSIDIEPCRDASWRLLIKAYDAAQDLAAAERARRSYASVLASLGVVDSTADLVARPQRPR